MIVRLQQPLVSLSNWLMFIGRLVQLLINIEKVVLVKLASSKLSHVHIHWLKAKSHDDYETAVEAHGENSADKWTQK